MLPRLKLPVALAVAAVAGLLLYGLQAQSDRLTASVSDLNQQITSLFTTSQPSPLAEEHVIDLPEDGQTWSTVFLWPADRQADPAARRLAAQFAEPRLQALLAQTKTTHYTPDNPLYAARYAASMGTDTPQFWLMMPDAANPSQGTTVYNVTAANMPPTGSQMADQIQAAIERICPRPRPTPTPPAPPIQPPNPPNLTTPTPPVPEPEDDIPLWAWMLPVIAAGAGALHEWRRSS